MAPPLASKRPTIKNLSVQTAYFQNGLVKAKLAWQVETNWTPNSQQEASISAKTLVDQPMFTITWFAIKCVKSDTVTMSQRQLPTPITATTINTHFEIYELKYNCDYVVNVRLAANSQQQTAQTDASSSLQRLVAPQIASAQFKVPACSQIKIVGRIQPMCYETPVRDVKNPANSLYSIFSTQSTPLSTVTTSESTLTTTATSTTAFPQLPRVYHIRYECVFFFNLDTNSNL